MIISCDVTKRISIFKYNSVQYRLYILLTKEKIITCDSDLKMPSKAKHLVANLCPYTDHAGLQISVNLHIAPPFSLQTAIGNGGPISALESMGAKPNFRCHFVKY